MLLYTGADSQLLLKHLSMITDIICRSLNVRTNEQYVICCIVMAGVECTRTCIFYEYLYF